MNFKAFKISAYHNAIVSMQWTSYGKFMYAQLLFDCYR